MAADPRWVAMCHERCRTVSEKLVALSEMAEQLARQLSVPADTDRHGTVNHALAKPIRKAVKIQFSNFIVERKIYK